MASVATYDAEAFHFPEHFDLLPEPTDEVDFDEPDTDGPETGGPDMRPPKRRWFRRGGTSGEVRARHRPEPRPRAYSAPYGYRTLPRHCDRLS